MTGKSKTDETIEALYHANPLLAFSLYTHLQAKTLNQLADEILATLDASIQGANVDASGFRDVYGKFWLWVLGSYEVVRTMSDAKTGAANCFSDRVKRELEKLKGSLADVRVPFAKQEIRGKRRPVSSELSVSDFDPTKCDVAFSIDGRRICVRGIISEFRAVFSEISRADVLKDLRNAPTLL